MRETKSELKVIVFCIVIIGSNLLGIDLVALAQFLTGQEGKEVVQVAQDGISQARLLMESNKDASMSFYIMVLGSIYGTGRTILKSVAKYVEGKADASNKVGTSLE